MSRAKKKKKKVTHNECARDESLTGWGSIC